MKIGAVRNRRVARHVRSMSYLLATAWPPKGVRAASAAAHEASLHRYLARFDSPHAKPASNSAAAGLHLMPGYPAAWDQRVQEIEVIRLGEVKVDAVQSRPESTGGSI